MKKILIFLMIILAGGIAYWFWSGSVDRSEVFCSKEAKLCPDGSGVGRTGPSCEFARCPSGGDSPMSQKFTKGSEEWIRYKNEEMGLQFEYRDNPEGYIIQDYDKEGASDPLGPVNAWNLMTKKDYEDLQNTDTPREGPATISVEVYFPGPNITPEEWIKQNTRSNYEKGTDIKNTTLDGKPAVMYHWLGLYEGDSIVVARKGWIYVFSVLYSDKNSPLIKDFNEFIKTARVL